MDHNLIQSPDLIRRLQRRLGLRQAHITPTLGETVQAVVLLDDITDQRSDTAKYAACQTIAGALGDGATLRSTVMLWNPPNSGKRTRVLACNGLWYTTALTALASVSFGGGFLSTPLGTVANVGSASFTDTANVLTKPVTQVLTGRASANVGGTATQGWGTRFFDYAGEAGGQTFGAQPITWKQLWLEQGFYVAAQLSTIAVGDRILDSSWEFYEEDL